MDNLLNTITADEWEMIDDYRDVYVGASITDPMTPSKEILNYWAEAKDNLYKLLGSNLLVSKDFSYSKPETVMASELESYLEGWSVCGREERDAHAFWQNIWNWKNNNFPISEYFYSPEKGAVIYNETTEEINRKNRKMRLLLNDFLRVKGLAINKYEGESFSITMPDGKELKINNGCKPMKILAKIAKAWNLEGYEDFRLCQSYVANTKFLSGTLYLSIHPLDYMTMSDNECDWDSCMGWQNEGCYRQGTVEMMNSPYVIVAYLAAADDMGMPRGNSWYNKKWRQLFIVDKNVLFGIKAYPYANEELSEKTIDWIKELAEINMGWTYEQEKAIHWSYDDELFVNNESFFLKFYTNFMYNDVGSANFHHLYYSKDILKNSVVSGGKRYVDINYSGISECMWCGSIENLREDSLCCDNCEQVAFCSCCGERIYDEDEICYVGNDTLCRYCYDERIGTCDSCCDDFDNDDLKTIKVYINNEDNQSIYVIDYNTTLCPDCFNNFVKENVINKDLTVIYQDSWEEQIYCINIEDLKLEAASKLLPYSLSKAYEKNSDITYFRNSIKTDPDLRYYVSYYSMESYIARRYDELI